MLLPSGKPLNGVEGDGGGALVCEFIGELVYILMLSLKLTNPVGKIPGLIL